jgi:hypothetical protein
MTIREALEKVDKLKPNQFEDEDKIRWLNDLDAKIKTEIIDTHEGADEVTFNGYDADTDTDTELIVPEPYSDIYLHYLFAQIDFNNAEYTRYNNSISMFNSKYNDFAAHYNRTHMPLQNNSITLE